MPPLSELIEKLQDIVLEEYYKVVIGALEEDVLLNLIAELDKLAYP